MPFVSFLSPLIVCSRPSLPHVSGFKIKSELSAWIWWLFLLKAVNKNEQAPIPSTENADRPNVAHLLVLTCLYISPFAHNDVLKIRQRWVVRYYERQMFFLSFDFEHHSLFFLLDCWGSLLHGGVFWIGCMVFSKEGFTEEFVLRRRRASPLINPFLTLGGWQEEKWVYRKFLWA